MEELIEIKVYSQELEKDINCKIFISHFNYDNRFIIKKFYLENILYFEFKEQPYINLLQNTYEDHNHLVTKHVTGKIIESIINKTNISVIHFDFIRHEQSVLIQSEFYILGKKYRNNTKLFSSEYHNYINAGRDYYKLNGLIDSNDKHRITQPIIFNILKEVFSDIYYHTEKDFFGYFEKHELEKILLKKQLANF